MQPLFYDAEDTDTVQSRRPANATHTRLMNESNEQKETPHRGKWGMVRRAKPSAGQCRSDAAGLRSTLLANKSKGQQIEGAKRGAPGEGRDGAPCKAAGRPLAADRLLTNAHCG